jgi:hypothetical protein
MEKSEAARKELELLDKQVEKYETEFDDIHLDFVVSIALVETAVNRGNIIQVNKKRFEMIDEKSRALMNNFNKRKIFISQLCGKLSRKYEEDLLRKTAAMIDAKKSSADIREMQDNLGVKFYGAYIENRYKQIEMYRKASEEFKKMDEILKNILK